MVTRADEGDDVAATQLAGLLALLADQTRLRILRILAQGERNVGSLGEELQLSQPTVSHHLGLLRSQNLVATRRMGKKVFYSLNGSLEHNGGALNLRTRRFDIRIARRQD